MTPLSDALTAAQRSALQAVTTVNLCRSCGKDFSGLEGFDRHRVGVHAYTYSEGLKLDPPREDGRRCLTTDELLEDGGWATDAKGRWMYLPRANRARERFGQAR